MGVGELWPVTLGHGCPMLRLHSRLLDPDALPRPTSPELLPFLPRQTTHGSSGRKSSFSLQGLLLTWCSLSAWHTSHSFKLAPVPDAPS
jgi:hypothetical protein